MKFEWKFMLMNHKKKSPVGALIGIIDNQKLMAFYTKIGEFTDKLGEGYGIWTRNGFLYHGSAFTGQAFPYFEQYDVYNVKSITMTLDMTQENGILRYVIEQPGFEPADKECDNTAWDDIDIHKQYRMAVLFYGTTETFALQR